MKRRGNLAGNSNKRAKLTEKSKIFDNNNIHQNEVILEDAIEIESFEEEIKTVKKKKVTKLLLVDRYYEKKLKNRLKNLDKEKEFYSLPKEFDLNNNSQKKDVIKFVVKVNDNDEFEIKNLYVNINKKKLLFKEIGSYLIIYCLTCPEAKDLHSLLNDYLVSLDLKKCKLPRDIKNDSLTYKNVTQEIEKSIPTQKKYVRKTEKNIGWQAINSYEQSMLEQQFRKINVDNFFVLPKKFMISSQFMRLISNVKFIFKISSAPFENDKVARSVQINDKKLMFRQAESFLIIYCNKCKDTKELHQLFNQYLKKLKLEKCLEPTVLTEEMSVFKEIHSTISINSPRNKDHNAIDLFKNLENNKLFIIPDEFIKDNLSNKTSSGKKQVKFAYLIDKNNVKNSHAQEMQGSFFGEKEKLFITRPRSSNLLIIFSQEYSTEDALLKLLNNYRKHLNLPILSEVTKLKENDLEYTQIQSELLKKQVRVKKDKKPTTPRKMTLEKNKNQVIDFFTNTQFYRVGKKGEFLFCIHKDFELTAKYYRKFRKHVFFEHKVDFNRINCKEKSVLYFNYNETMKDFFAENIDNPNIKILSNTIENKEITTLFDYSGNRHFTESQGMKKFLFKSLILSTAAERAQWLKLEESNDCYIYFPQDIIDNIKLFSYFFSYFSLQSSESGNYNFKIVKKFNNYIKVKNYESLIYFLESNNCDTPIIEIVGMDKINAIENNNKKLFSSYWLPIETYAFEEGEKSPFLFLNLIKYNALVKKIKDNLPENLHDSFSFTPKTTFYLNSSDDILKFNAVLKVVRGENVKFVKSGGWENNFCIKIVDSLSRNSFEFGVFAARNISFKSGERLGNYGYFIEGKMPSDLTFAYELEDGYIDIRTANDEVHLSTASLMNTTNSEYDAFIRSIQSTKNNHTLDVIVTDITQDKKISLKKDEQVFNFYSPTYLPVLEQKNISFVPLNKYHGNLTLNEEYPKERLENDYVSRGSLNDQGREKLKSLLRQNGFFESKNKVSGKKIVVPKLTQGILEDKPDNWEQYSHQAEYPLLIEKSNKLCRRSAQTEITPLMVACYCGHDNAIKFLLALNVVINRADAKLNTAIFYALNNPDNNENSIALLSQSKKLDITVQNNEGDTPIHHALFKKKSTKVIEELLSANTYNFDYLDIENHKKISVGDAVFETEDESIISLFNGL